MSHLLYSHRLMWDGRGGVATRRNVRLVLSMAPAPFPDAQYIDYAPEVRVAQIRRAHGPMRDMTADEIATAEAFLREAIPEVPDATPAAA